MPQAFQTLYGRAFLGNSLQDYAVCALSIALGLLFVKLFQVLVMRRLRKWLAVKPSAWDDLLVAALEANAVPALYLLVVYLGLRDLEMKPVLAQALRVAATGGITVLAARVILAGVNQGLRAYWVRHADDKTAAKERSLQGIVTLAQVVIWLLAGLLLLDNVGVRISAFMAGLGITGIAVALAAQAILGDVFAYFVIFFDEPFEVGHAIKVDGFTGEVEHIGLKTTRLRSVDGEQVVFSNKFLTDSRIQNFKRMDRRRVVISFEVEPVTPEESLRGVPGLVQGLLSGFPDVSFDRAHLVAIGEAGLRFEVAYMVETPDFKRHLDVRQEFNLGLASALRKAGIALAAPRGVVYLRGTAGEAGPAGRPGAQ